MNRVAISLAVATLLAWGVAPPASPGEAPRATERGAQPAKQPQARAERAFGREGDARKVTRTISIRMSDAMRFFPSEVRVKRGDTVRLVLVNNGRLGHEIVIGTMDDLKRHAALMKRNASAHAEEANAAHVAPGATARIVWQFTRPGEFYYACLVPGHFDAGLIGTIVVR